MNNKLLLLCVFGLMQLCTGDVLANTQSSFTEKTKTGAFLLPPPPDTTILDTVSIVTGEIVTRCLDTSELTGPVDTIFFCPDSPHSDDIVSFVLVQTTKCVKYRGLSCGTDSACIVLCDVNGVCDTTLLVVSALDPGCFPQKEFFYDTLFVNTSRDYCADLSELSGNVVSIENDCPASSGSSIIFAPDGLSYCVNYSAFEVGTDTACIVIRDDRGFTDSLCMIITGKRPVTEMICDTIELGTDTLYCLVNEELDGNIVSMTNICPQSSGNSINFTANPVNLCLEAIAFELGTDSACIIICDEFDICDTTIFKITVVPGSVDTMQEIIAVNDTTTTSQNTPLVIDVLDNDTIPGGAVTVKVIQAPQNGSTIVHPDFTIEYIPERNFCGQDSFIYQVCNAVACDTATVFIDVPCFGDTIVIFNGLSPNGDGTNDTFKILHIEDFPDNIVRIFNRWGNMVFEAEGYRNTWDGTWEGKDLPDGTYFYLIDLQNGQQYTGYLQIQR